MTHLSKTLFVCCLLSQIMACTDNIDSNTPMDKSATEPTTTSTTTINGIVYDLQSGKDGYTATISTADTTIYYAVVSIPNVGGLENYTKLELGSAVTLSGELLKNGSENNFIVRTIDNQQPTELCWLATKTTNLYSAPNADSKNYGKFFQGETLTVLADPIQNNNQNWTKYTLEIP